MDNKETEYTKDSYLAFRLGGEIFAVSVHKVLEILELQVITKVPHTPQYMRGVINMRGEVIPVVDTRIKFNMSVSDDTVRTVIIVLDLFIKNKKVIIGAVADSVKEVLEITEAQIKDAPEIGSNYNTEFIKGMIKSSDDKFIMLLDIDAVFASEDIELIRDISDINIVNTQVNNL
ncbi:MAG: hypothetical protein A2X12_10825 [Bacteroidetes bacterium GWE2_29_8]|nr:MAG: hypothetical protein A2X12_10825 [Bacteroidetes bacterium GWE2_29_8]OFY17410.1 MAG: hypothetical protein A2X02_00750 [Bacteroidetes bacterium GWF2_29_10]